MEPNKTVEILRLAFTGTAAVMRFVEATGKLDEKAKQMKDLHFGMLDLIGEFDREEINIEEFGLKSQLLLIQMEILAAMQIVPKGGDELPSGGIVVGNGEFVPIDTERITGNVTKPPNVQVLKDFSEKRLNQFDSSGISEAIKSLNKTMGKQNE